MPQFPIDGAYRVTAASGNSIEEARTPQVPNLTYALIALQCQLGFHEPSWRRMHRTVRTHSGALLLAKNWNWWSRKGHRWGAILSAIPMLLVIATGLLLQVKKQVPWVQPPTAKGQSADVTPQQDWQNILAAVSSIPEAEIESWSDIDRLDVRPGKGVVKVRSKNHWEVQLDLYSGAVLASSLRRSDVIESLHDGSFFSDAAKLWLFLPNGLILLGLWITGLWLWYLPLSKRRQRIRKRAAPQHVSDV